MIERTLAIFAVLALALIPVLPGCGENPDAQSDQPTSTDTATGADTGTGTDTGSDDTPDTGTEPDPEAAAEAAAELERKKWDEITPHVEMIREVISVYFAKWQPQEPVSIVGAWPEVVESLDGDTIESLSYFNAEDFHVSIAGVEKDYTYTITVNGTESANEDAPDGVYTIDQDGNETKQ
jgi:hypothetical protein